MGVSNSNLAHKHSDRFEFGLDHEPIVKMLRELADDIEAARTIPQTVTTYRKTDLDDYPMTSLVMKFTEKLGIPSRRDLYSSHNQFPVDSAIRK